MYYNANDNELLYLIKDGNRIAKIIFYDKYSHLIKKIYYEQPRLRSIIFSDYQQECLMCLEKAIFSFDEKYSCSFYTYFSLVLRRLISKLFRNDALKVKEGVTEYSTFDNYINKKDNLNLVKIIKKEFETEPLEIQQILEYCIFQNYSLSAYTREFHLKYYEVYTLFKKINQKIEKILTNLKD